jgi:hypothetical protein
MKNSIKVSLFREGVDKRQDGKRSTETNKNTELWRKFSSSRGKSCVERTEF